MTRKKTEKIPLLGIVLIIIAVFKPVRNIILWLLLTKGDIRALLSNWYSIIKGLPDYPALGSALDNLYSIYPIYQGKIIGFITAFIQTYLPFLCKLALLISGIGFFFKKNIFRRIAIMALCILLAIEIADLILLTLYAKQFYLDTLISLILFTWIVYYLTQSKVKEQFK